MKKLSENNKIEVVSEAIKVAIGSSLLSALLYAIDQSTDFLKILDITSSDVIMIGASASGFCLLWILLDKWFFTPFVNLHEKREQLTVGAEDVMKQKETEIAEMLEQYEIKTIEARTEAVKEKSASILNAKNESNKLVDAAKHTAQETISKARAEFTDRKSKLKNDSTKEAQVLADQMVSKVLSAKGVNN